MQDGTLSAARIINPPLQRIVSMAFARNKGPGRAASAVARQIAQIVDEQARAGMWRSTLQT
ncbi:hypothetical protein D3C71_2179480 [compost metagenome]